jgi:EamA domain-containing membrane protein RarD
MTRSQSTALIAVLVCLATVGALSLSHAGMGVRHLSIAALALCCLIGSIVFFIEAIWKRR